MLNDQEIFKDVLADVHVGCWKIESDEGRAPRMYVDATMKHLLGIDDAHASLSPEAVYRAWHDRIDAAHLDAVDEGIRDMLEGDLAEIQYPWHHPDGRIIIVRCGGVRDLEYTAGLRFKGIHQWVTAMRHVDRALEAQEHKLDETVKYLENANEHEKLRADALDFIQKDYELESFFKFFSKRVLELYGCHQVIYRDAQGRMIIDEKPGTPPLDFSLCKDCQHYDFNAPVYADGVTIMDDCSIGYKGVPVHEKCHVKASLTQIVYSKGKPFGYIALHYLDSTHHFTPIEIASFDRLAKFLSLVLDRADNRRRELELMLTGERSNIFHDLVHSGEWSFVFDENRQCVQAGHSAKLREQLDPIISDGLYGWQKIVHPDDLARVQKAWTTALEDRSLQTDFRAEYRMRNRDGEYRYYQSAGRVIKRPDGLYEIFGIHIDINDTVNRRMEANRNEADTMMALLEDLDSLFVLDPESGLYEIFLDGVDAIERDTVMKQSGHSIYVDAPILAQTVIHEEDRPQFLACYSPENLKKIAATGVAQEIENRWMINGEPYWFRNKLVRRIDADGKVNLIIGVWNVTEEYCKAQMERDAEERRRHELEKALIAANEEQLRNDTLHEIIHSGKWSFFVNRRDEIVEARYSDAVCKVIGNDLANGVSYAWVEIIHPDDREQALAAFNATIADHTCKTPYDVKYRMIDRHGVYHWFHSAGRIIRDANGDGEFFGVHIDITDTIEAEHERQKQLEEALHMAQSANRAKTMFLNNMSHDIRTPMNAIIGFTGLAASHLESKMLVKDYLMKISQSSDHLLSLINDVLDMARIESGKMNLNEKAESLPDIIHSLRNIIQSQISDKQLDFYIDCCDVKNENIICDKLRLSQVFLNVLSNAVKYTPTGGTVSLRISEKGVAQSRPAGDGKAESGVQRARYVFAFKDSGVGMSSEYLKEIFDPFSRAKNTTISGIQGTGLGMAITKNIVDMMGGDIQIRSAVGKGTEVTINFEFQIGGEMQIQSQLSALKGLKALVADDDVNSCLSVAATLKEIGMHPEWCTSGKEAVIRAKTAFNDGEPFRVYLIDWLIPDMNGIETVRRIRKLIGKDMPIIILTAYDWSEIEEEAIEAGVTAFVAKPLFASELRKVLSEQIEGGIGRQPREKAATERTDRSAEYATAVEASKKHSVRHILLVEDNEINREIAVVILTEQGFEVDIAVNGAEAVEKVKLHNGKAAIDVFTRPYDFVLMDIQMPVMNGYEATKAIRAAGFTLPIVAMTANAFVEDRNAAFEAGMNDHLVKPVKVYDILSCIKKFGM